MGGSTMTSINQLFDNFEKAQRDLRLGLQKALKASGAMASGEALDSLGVELKTVDVYYGLRTRKEASSFYKLLIHGPMGDREVSFPRQAYEYFAESTEPNILKEPNP